LHGASGVAELEDCAGQREYRAEGTGRLPVAADSARRRNTWHPHASFVCLAARVLEFPPGLP